MNNRTCIDLDHHDPQSGSSKEYKASIVRVDVFRSFLFLSQDCDQGRLCLLSLPFMYDSLCVAANFSMQCFVDLVLFVPLVKLEFPLRL